MRTAYAAIEWSDGPNRDPCMNRARKSLLYCRSGPAGSRPRGRIWSATRPSTRVEFQSDEEERLIAGLVGFQDPEHLWAWKFTYDPAVASYSPGRLLWTEVLRWSHARGKRVMDFMPSRYDWKYAFTARDVEVTSGFVPLSWRGHLFARAWNTPLREQLWRWRRRPAWWPRTESRASEAGHALAKRSLAANCRHLDLQTQSESFR